MTSLRRFTCLLILFLSPASSFGETYTTLDLGVIGAPAGSTGASSWVSGINDSGQIAGTTIYFINGVQSTVGFVTGPNGTGYRTIPLSSTLSGETFLEAINNSGQTVIQTYVICNGAVQGSNLTLVDSDGVTRTTIFVSGSLGCGPSVQPNGPGSLLNASGQVIGTVQGSGLITGPNATGATLFDTVAGDLQPRTVYPTGVNTAGQVAGYELPTTGGYYRAFITDPNGANMREIGAVSSTVYMQYGYAINDSGQVVGIYDTTAGQQGIFITGPNGTNARPLGAPGTTNNRPCAMNNAGQVVGQSDSGAFVTGPNGSGVTYLPSIADQCGGYNISINNAGQIAGISSVNYGHVVLLSPVTPTNSSSDGGDVPTLPQWAAILLGLLLIGSAALRRV